MAVRFATSFFTFLLLLSTKMAMALAANSTAIPPIAKDGCQAMCGNVSVPYPFGIGSDCFMNPWFEVSCNGTSTPPIILLKSINMEVLDFSYITGYQSVNLRVKSPVISKNCSGSRGSRESSNNNNTRVNLIGSPFFYLDTSNKFIAAGCNSKAFIAGIEPRIVGCESNCTNGGTLFGSSGYHTTSTCNNGTCCETLVPSDLKTFDVAFEKGSSTSDSDGGGCKLAFVAEQEWLDNNITNTSDLQNMDYVPALLDWSIPIDSLNIGMNNGMRYYYCYFQRYSNGSTERYPNNTVRCYCDDGYEGNPYLPNGCQDIDECEEVLDQHYPRCGDATCVNLPGSYRCEGSRTWIIGLGVGVGFGVLCLVIGGWWLYKYLKKRRNLKLKKKYFQT